SFYPIVNDLAVAGSGDLFGRSATTLVAESRVGDDRLNFGAASAIDPGSGNPDPGPAADAPLPSRSPQGMPTSPSIPLMHRPLVPEVWLHDANIALIGIVGVVAASLVGGLIAAIGSVRWLPPPAKASSARASLPEDLNDRQACLILVEQSASLWRGAEASVLRLDHAAPIRALLLGELRKVEQRLSRDVNTSTMRGGALTTRQATDYWKVLRQRLRGTARDLERILATAEAAVETLGDHLGHEPKMPRTREEALLVLGASQGADDQVLSRLVRALRQCWHPDLAQTEADRSYRHARLAQINVAYDVLTGRRSEG
ncbi:MAG: hypothetical protein AAGC70_21385, partial [Pseudomonadota bacterium]